MSKIYVRFKKLTETAVTPTKATAWAAGYDLYVDTTQDITIEPGETVPFYTGLAFEIPDGYAGYIFSRSGIATKNGVRIANCVGVIDSDYRGNVGVPLHNDSSEPFTVKAHERVAQLIITPVPDVIFMEDESLTETARGANGFGSTGRT